MLCSLANLMTGTGDVRLMAIVDQQHMLASLSPRVDVGREMFLDELLEDVGVAPARLAHLDLCSWQSTVCTKTVERIFAFKDEERRKAVTSCISTCNEGGQSRTWRHDGLRTVTGLPGYNFHRLVLTIEADFIYIEDPVTSVF